MTRGVSLRLVLQKTCYSARSEAWIANPSTYGMMLEDKVSTGAGIKSQCDPFHSRVGAGSLSFERMVLERSSSMRG